MGKYIVYDIEACEDLKFAKTNMQSDSEETMVYIPGTSIRGAYIYKYIVGKGVRDINKGIHRQKLLNGQMKFLNAYPKHEDKRSIPFPKCYFAPKEEIKGANKKLRIKSGLDIRLEPGYEKVRTSEFVGLEGEEYFKVNVEKTSNLHINKMRGKENNKLFRYEAMKKGQVFQGIIKVEEDSYIDEVKELFEDAIVYLGGSKGSGYGKCRIKNLKVLESNPEYEDFKIGNLEEEIYLLALSDIIFRNEIGEYKTFIDEEYIAKELGLDKVEFIDSSIETKNITNFNNKWNCSTPNINSIQAGSVFKYRISEKVEKERLKDFIDRGIGERRLDGFGRFIILDYIRGSYIVEEKEGEDSISTNIEDIELSKAEKQQVKSILNTIYENRLEDDISRRVIELDEKIRNSEMMNRSQWGNYKGLFTSLIHEEPREGIKIYNNYMDNIKSKRSTSYNQLNKVTYDNGKLLDFLTGLVNDSTDVKLFNNESKVKKVSLGDLESSMDKEALYKYNMKILAELCRYQIRKGEE